MSEQEKREFAAVIAVQLQYFLGQREHDRFLTASEMRACRENATAFVAWFFGDAPPLVSGGAASATTAYVTSNPE
jgi:hypothetical protein